MENLTTYLLANTIVQDEKVEFDYKKVMENEEFFKLLRKNVTAEHEEKSE